MNERRIARIERQIKERIANVLIHEIADPRMGFVTISRVEVDKEMQKCVVYWSLLGDDTRRRLSEAALANATGFVRKEVARVLHTRTVPVLEFRFDESVAGAERMRGLLDELRLERGDPDPADPNAADPDPANPDSADPDGVTESDSAGEPEASPDGDRGET